MSTKIIVSYDGTANEQDAIALGRLFGDAGAEVSVAYVRHNPETDSVREEIAQAEAQSILDQGVELLGNPSAQRHVVTDRSTPDGLAALAAREGAEVIVFCSDSHTAKGHVAVGNSAERLLNGGRTAIAIAPVDLAEHVQSNAVKQVVAVGDADGGARESGRGARQRSRCERRAGRQRAGRPAGDRLAPGRRGRTRLAQLLRRSPDRDGHLAGARRAAWREAGVRRRRRRDHGRVGQETRAPAHGGRRDITRVQARPDVSESSGRVARVPSW